MIAEFDGIKVKIPMGYKLTEDGLYVNGHGVEYQLIQYGWRDDTEIYLEAVSGKYDRRILLERA